LLAARAFTSIALISLLTFPVLIFIQTLPGMIECQACFDRIQEFCNYTTLDDDVKAHGEPQLPPPTTDTEGSAIHLVALPGAGKSGDVKSSGGLMSIKDGNFGWDKQSQSMFLKNLSLSIEQQKMTVIVGPVGSGKTTLLHSMLGETVSSDHSRARPMASTAFCAQEAWLEKTTIRKNIIGVSEYDRQWYSTVVGVCGLEQDFQELENGDRTAVGSKGLNLSGGQKQRIVSRVFSSPSTIQCALTDCMYRL
jgi:ATP-binding cassette, subfamily C (CFTR/MRP), member 1